MFRWNEEMVGPEFSDMSEAFNCYLRKGHQKVSGWASSGAIRIVRQIDEFQKQRNFSGSVAEIGVHHGKFFIALHFLTRDNEQSLAVDLFERQHENTDKSGSGANEQNIFLSNLKQFGCRLERIKILKANSLDISLSEIMNGLAGQAARIFSIDGGHSARNTFNDLKKASQVLCQGGVIVLDDCFNECWPGVSEGLWRYLNQFPSALFPVAIGGGRLFLTNDEQRAEAYIKNLSEAHISDFIFSEFNGKNVIIFRFWGRYADWLGRTTWWPKIKNTKYGEWLKMFYRKINAGRRSFN